MGEVNSSPVEFMHPAFVASENSDADEFAALLQLHRRSNEIRCERFDRAPLPPGEAKAWSCRVTQRILDLDCVGDLPPSLLVKECAAAPRISSILAIDLRCTWSMRSA
jgi:hypothetical protein